MSHCRADPQKVSCAHNSLRTSARASEKVGYVLAYHAARRTVALPRAICRCARSVTSENSPNSAGVLRRIAFSDQSVSLGFEPEALTHLLESGLHLPAPDEPRDDLLRFGGEVGA